MVGLGWLNHFYWESYVETVRVEKCETDQMFRINVNIGNIIYYVTEVMIYCNVHALCSN